MKLFRISAHRKNFEFPTAAALIMLLIGVGIIEMDLY